MTRIKKVFSIQHSSQTYYNRNVHSSELGLEPFDIYSSLIPFLIGGEEYNIRINHRSSSNKDAITLRKLNSTIIQTQFANPYGGNYQYDCIRGDNFLYIQGIGKISLRRRFSFFLGKIRDLDGKLFGLDGTKSDIFLEDDIVFISTGTDNSRNLSQNTLLLDGMSIGYFRGTDPFVDLSEQITFRSHYLDGINNLTVIGQNKQLILDTKEFITSFNNSGSLDELKHFTVNGIQYSRFGSGMQMAIQQSYNPN